MLEHPTSALIGIDGGGTGCRVVIAAPDGSVLATASGGPANPSSNLEQACENILAALGKATVEAHLDRGALAGARLYAGLAGVRDDEIADMVAEALPVRQAIISEDRTTTVMGALAGTNGAVAAIGTGSFVAHNKAGHTTYIGGWGFQMGDQASGAWLGHGLLRTVLLCCEGIEAHTPLTRETLAGFGGKPGEIFSFGNKASPADFANFAPPVVKAANQGDTTATSLMDQGAAYIVRSLETLNYSPIDPLCLTGGVGPFYAPFLPARLADSVVKPKGSALDGALLLAAQMGESTPSK